MLVSQHCHNKYYKLDGLKQQKAILSQTWRLEVGNQGVSRGSSCEDCERESVPGCSPSSGDGGQSLAFLGP